MSNHKLTAAVARFLATAADWFDDDETTLSYLRKFLDEGNVEDIIAKLNRESDSIVILLDRYREIQAIEEAEEAEFERREREQDEVDYYTDVQKERRATGQIG